MPEQRSGAAADQPSSHPWDHPHELVGARGVARRLGLHPRYGEDVVRAGLAGPGYVTGRGRLVGVEAVDALARRTPRTAVELPPALVLRTGPPRQEDGRWVGAHTAMPDGAVRDAALRWWPLAAPDELVGGLVVVAVAGFAVWVGRVTGYERDGRLVALGAARADRPGTRDDDAETYYASRLRLPAGAPALRVRGSQATGVPSSRS